MKKILLLLLLSPYSHSFPQLGVTNDCMEKFPNDSKKFLNCVNKNKNGLSEYELKQQKEKNRNDLPEYEFKPQKEKNYNGWLSSRKNIPNPSAHVINDPETNYCSVYYKNGVKQSPYKNRNLGRYNRIICGGETLEDAVGYCLNICEGKISLQQAKINQQEKQKQAQALAWLERFKNICRAYGFKSENALATCVQTEINNEYNRMMQQQSYANEQARANAQARSNSMNSYSRCLSTEGSFSACANAWQGYTPKPPKKIYKCDYDVFGNQISSTCREQ